MRKKISLSKAEECIGRFAVRSSCCLLGREQVQIVRLDKRNFLVEFYEALNLSSLFQDKEDKKESYKFLIYN